MSETLFNKIISPIAILSKFTLPRLWAHIFYFQKMKNSKLNFFTNLWISLHLALITHDAFKSVNSSILTHFWNEKLILSNSLLFRCNDNSGKFGWSGFSIKCTKCRGNTEQWLDVAYLHIKWKKLFVKCGFWSWTESSNLVDNLSNCRICTWKNSGDFNGIQTHDLCDRGVTLSPTELHMYYFASSPSRPQTSSPWEKRGFKINWNPFHNDRWFSFLSLNSRDDVCPKLSLSDRLILIKPWPPKQQKKLVGETIINVFIIPHETLQIKFPLCFTAVY